jgi:hypothetical protein
MKKYKAFIVATAVLFIFCAPVASFAAGGSGELKFMGNANNLPVFQLVLKGKRKTEYLVTIRDNEKNMLLSEKLKGDKIRRRYTLKTDGMSWISGTTFEVTNKRTGETNIYEVNGTASVVEYVSVAKL